MVMGSVKRDRIALNHEWLWRGDHRDRDTSPRAHLLSEVREQPLAGRYEEGTRAGNEAFGGGGGISGTRHRVDAYQPAGDLFLELNHDCISDYRRELDMERAQVTVSYRSSQRRYTREYVAHLVKDVILIRVSAEGKPFDVALWLDRVFDPGCTLTSHSTKDRLSMQGRFASGVELAVRAAVRLRGGTARVNGYRIEAAGTVMPDGSWDELLRDHRAEHSRHYGGLSLELDALTPTMPTDERIRAYRAGAEDPALPLTYLNYGRYLLCASSANATLPPNLQGKWNEDLNPPWEADYHHDVNLQMCHWPAEPGHLQACTDALFTHMERFVPHARKAARERCRRWSPGTGTSRTSLDCTPASRSRLRGRRSCGEPRAALSSAGSSTRAGTRGGAGRGRRAASRASARGMLPWSTSGHSSWTSPRTRSWTCIRR